jgi:hypothetical protein
MQPLLDILALSVANQTLLRPFYFTGNKILIGLVCWNICAFVGCKVFYVTVNK